MSMKAFFLFAALSVFVGASVPYFKYLREVQVGGASGQHYFVVDETVWQHARPDLGDLRLYAADGHEVPYALSTERGSSETDQKDVKVLQPGVVGDKTQFFLDMSDLAEYDRITLKLRARNFVSKVRVEGQDDLHGAHWSTLANTIVYDLSDDNLGGNTTLRLPVTRYKYLRITLEGAVKPADIEAATANIKEEEKAVWRNISSEPKREEQNKETVFTFSVPANVPLERLEFTIDAAQPNFKREVEIQNGENDWPGPSGELSRVHMLRHGQKIDFEQSTLDLGGIRPDVLKVVIHNGDDPPLKITGVRLEQYERRAYFNSSDSPHLYYGDEKLDEPVYDYAKLFQAEANATQSQLGAEQTNTAFTGRPDERPWSDKHPAVLWIAIVAAVLVLGVMALRSMKNTTAA
ncbi:MAG TPA: DUF3999 family protein [Terriglobales bacterium]|jgi:hypothetical protein|nr:DUF3999 family protein [Terriglobales bacterium]